MPVLDYLQHAAPARVDCLFLQPPDDASDASGPGHGMKRSFPRADRSQIPSPGLCGSPRTVQTVRFERVERVSARLPQSHDKIAAELRSVVNHIDEEARNKTGQFNDFKTQMGRDPSRVCTEPQRWRCAIRPFRQPFKEGCCQSCRIRADLVAALQLADASFRPGRDLIDVLTPDKARDGTEKQCQRYGVTCCSYGGAGRHENATNRESCVQSRFTLLATWRRLLCWVIAW